MNHCCCSATVPVVCGLHFFLALSAEATTTALESQWLHFLPLFLHFLLSHFLPSTLTFVSVQQQDPFILGGLVALLGFSASGYFRTLLMVTTAPPPLPWIPDSWVLTPTLFLPHFLGGDSSYVIPQPCAPVALPNCSPMMREAPFRRRRRSGEQGMGQPGGSAVQPLPPVSQH